MRFSSFGAIGFELPEESAAALRCHNAGQCLSRDAKSGLTV
jgi:hypothetical protein